MFLNKMPGLQPVSSVLITLALGPALLAQPSATQSTSPQKSVTSLSTKGSATMPMPLVAPLFIEDDQRMSVITIVNNAPQGVDVDVVLYSLSGDHLVQQTVALSPRSERSVAVGDLLGDSAVRYGSVFLLPHRPSTMAAQLSIAGRGGDSVNDVEEEFQMLMGSAPANFRAVSISTAPLIAVRSLSAEEQTLQVACFQGHNGNKATDGKVTIGPNRTLLIDACATGGPRSLSAPTATPPGNGEHLVAVAISSSVASSELAVFGFGSTGGGSGRGFVAMPFADANGLRSSGAVFPGITKVAGNSTKIQGSAANFGAVPRRATFILVEGGAQKEVATLQLAPHSIGLLNLTDAVRGAHGDASVVVSADGEPGEVMTGIQALSSPNDSSSNLAFPWKDRAERANGGQHPWRIDGGFSSTIVLFNPDQTASNSIALSVYADNKTWTKLVPVPPQSTVIIRLDDIINKQEPDDKGRTLSHESTHGIVGWFTLTNPRIFGHVVQVNALNHVVRPFACAQYTDICGADVTNLQVGVGLQGQVNAVGKTCGSDGNCTCVEQCGSTGGGTFSNWGSSDTNIATLVSSFSSSATFQGQSAGNAFSQVTISGNGCNQSAGAQVAVLPVVNLSVSSTSLTVARQNGTATFTVDASASGGFTGTISGSITVSQPSNPNQVVLDVGSGSQTYNFTLSSGQSTSGTCNVPATNCFTITTSAQNQQSGNLVYTVTIDPSGSYTIGSTSPKQVTVTVQ